MPTFSRNGDEIFPASPIHPGQHIADELAARQLAQKELARLTGISAAFIGELIRGKKSISLAMAVKLETALDLSAEFWVNAQRQYNRDVAYHKAKRELARLDLPEARQRTLLKAAVV